MKDSRKENGMSITEQGYDNLIHRIVNRAVVLPEGDMNARDLTQWLNGYTTCQLDVLDIIDQLKKGQRE